MNLPLLAPLTEEEAKITAEDARDTVYPECVEAVDRLYKSHEILRGQRDSRSRRIRELEGQVKDLEEKLALASIAACDCPCESAGDPPRIGPCALPLGHDGPHVPRIADDDPGSGSSLRA